MEAIKRMHNMHIHTIYMRFPKGQEKGAEIIFEEISEKFSNLIKTLKYIYSRS